MKTKYRSLYLGFVAILLCADCLYADIEKIADDAPQLHFKGDFPSAWATREDGTTALLFKGKLIWESRVGTGTLTAESTQVTVEAVAGTEYRLFYADSADPLTMKPDDISAITQEIMQNRITEAFAIGSSIQIQEHGRITISAKVFVFHTSLPAQTRNEKKKQNKPEMATPRKPSD